MKINVRENQEWTIQRNRQQWVHKPQDEDSVGQNYAQTNTNNVSPPTNN